MRYAVQEKLFSIGDDFWITDEGGGKAFLVDGKVLRLRQTLEIQDPDGRVLVPGGFSAPDTPQSSSDIYDPSTGTFTITGNTPMVPTTTLLTNGKVLVAGGDEGDGSVASMRAQLFNAATPAA